MRKRRTNNFVAVCEAVRKYQRRIAPVVSTEGTLVPLARWRDFSRLLRRHLFVGGGVIQQGH